MKRRPGTTLRPGPRGAAVSTSYMAAKAATVQRGVPSGINLAGVGDDFHGAMQHSLAPKKWSAAINGVLRGNRWSYETCGLFHGIPRPKRAEVPYSFSWNAKAPGSNRLCECQQASVADAILGNRTIIDWKLCFKRVAADQSRCPTLQWLWGLYAFPEAPEFWYVFFEIVPVQRRAKIRTFRLVRRLIVVVRRGKAFNARIKKEKRRIAKRRLAKRS